MQTDISTPVCTLTPDKIVFKLKKWGDNDRNWRKQTFDVESMNSFLSLNFLSKSF